jgi:hypothetical protein
MAQRLAHAFEPRERADRREDMRRVGPLLAPLLEPAAGAGLIQDQVEPPLLGPASHQARAKLRDDGVVATGGGELQAERILPVQAAAHRVRGLPVGQPFNELPHGDQCQTPRRFGGLSTGRKEGGDVVVAVEGAQRVAQLDDQRAVRETGVHDAGRFVRDGRDGQDLERHGAPPWSII